MTATPPASGLPASPDPVWERCNRGETYVIEGTNMRADGTRFPVEVYSAGFDHDGRKCIVAVARDLSGRRDVELHYRELMEVINQGVLVRDANGRVVHANAAAMRLFNISPGESVDQALQSPHWLIVDEFGQGLTKHDCPGLRALRSGQVVASTVLGYYQRQLCQLTWLSVTAVPQYAAGSDRRGRGNRVATQFPDRSWRRSRARLPVRARPVAR